MKDSTHSLAHRYGCNFRILGLAQVVMSNGDLKPPLVDPISSSQWSTVCAGFWNAEVNEKDCLCCMHRWLGGEKYDGTLGSHREPILCAKPGIF